MADSLEGYIRNKDFKVINPVPLYVKPMDDNDNSKKFAFLKSPDFLDLMRNYMKNSKKPKDDGGPTYGGSPIGGPDNMRAVVSPPKEKKEYLLTGVAGFTDDGLPIIYRVKLVDGKEDEVEIQRPRPNLTPIPMFDIPR